MAKESLLTVLFCDLVGSTKLSSQFDPEDWREVVRAYQQVSASVLQRRGGHIAQYQGDGLLVYFGYPEPHAGDAVQAVEAGLEIVAAVEELNETLQHEYEVTLAVRVGVHTGPAVFGEFGEEGHGEQLAVGETPAIAAGIQDFAVPNAVVVSGTTLEYLPETLTRKDLGSQAIKGVAEPVQVVQVQMVAVTVPREKRMATPLEREERPDEAERRQLTVMFCQLAGAAKLAAQLSPEAVLNLVQDYQTASAEVISQYDGHIAQYLDTGLLVYFGYPTAHEDDARRAVRAGLAILEATRSLNARVLEEQGVEAALRMGIHTGLVVAGEVGGGGRTEQLAMGETPNVAARVQSMATSGTVAISPATANLISGHFEWEELGYHTLKGVPEPLLLRRIVRESTAQSRFDTLAAKNLAHMVGREAEEALLRERWNQGQSGQGQVIFVSGEAGIGKSRLIDALREQVGTESATQLRLRCSSYSQNSAFYSLIELLQLWSGFEREDSSEGKLAKLKRKLAGYQFTQVDTFPLLAAFLSLPSPEDAPSLSLSPQQQRRKTQEVLVAWLAEEARRQPTLVIWEDLHWIDPSSLEVLDLLVTQLEAIRLCLVLTARSEFAPAWDTQIPLTHVVLQQLGAAQIEDIVANVTDGRQLPAELMEQIVTKTDGIPLFIEELTKMLLESEALQAVNSHYELTAPLSAVSIPVTLQDSLMARLDRLGSAKGVAQVGAVIGREFSYDVLQAIRPEGETGLAEALGQLVAADLVSQYEQPPHASYQFKHALIQDTAYESLLRRTRQRHHRQIAEVLEARFDETVESRPELVAHHYTEARLAEQAIPRWQQAGQDATQRSANVEAVNHLTKGLELLKTLPDTSERVQQELTLQVTLGPALMATKGIVAPEVDQAYSRALELCQQMGETPYIFPVMRGLQLFYLSRDPHKARDLAEQMLALAESLHNPVSLLGAHFTLGQTLFLSGEIRAALPHLEEGIALYDPQQDQSLFWAGAHAGVQCLGYAAWALWVLGYQEQGLKKANEAIALAQELNHPFSLGFALFCAARLYQPSHQVQITNERAEALRQLATEQEFSYYLILANIYLGWVQYEQGQGEEGLDMLRRGVDAKRVSGVPSGQLHFLAVLAEIYGKAGQPEEGLTVIAEALEIFQKTEDRLEVTEPYRIKGELLLQAKGQSAEAEAGECFQQAIDIARSIEAKTLELRAVMSLARLWQGQGKKAEAHQRLSETYNWFTEGFDTKDLQEGKVLLDALS